MEVEKVHRAWYEFLDINSGLIHDFSKIAKFDIDLADALLDDPDETIKIGNTTYVELQNKPQGDHKKVCLQIKNLPVTSESLIRQLRGRHLNKFLKLKGVVKQKTDVVYKVATAKFECPSCGVIINIIQTEKKLKEPTKCTCGRKGKFNLLDTETNDMFQIKIEEPPESITGDPNLKSILCVLENHLVKEEVEGRIYPGVRLIINGIYKTSWKYDRGGKNTELESFIEVNSVEFLEADDFLEGEINLDIIQKFHEFAKTEDPVEFFSKKIFQGIMGHDLIKRAVVVQMFGGIHKVTSGMETRGAINIFLCGDVGTAKSAILRTASRAHPKARYVGNNVTAAGLIGSAEHDEMLGTWTVKAGEYTLANQGLIMIDELEKQTTDTHNAILEVMNDQCCTISKAAKAKFQARTGTLAAANPASGRWDDYETSLVKQFKLPAPLLDRFDLIFIIRDNPDDTLESKKIMDFLTGNSSENSEEFDVGFFRKYLTYAKKINPYIPPEIVEFLHEKYGSVRKMRRTEQGRNVTIGKRQLVALIRITEAVARARLHKHATFEDAELTWHLMWQFLNQVCVDAETGFFDVDIVSTGKPASMRTKIKIVNDCIPLKGQEAKNSDQISKETGIDIDYVEEMIMKLSRNGDIVEARRGHYYKMP